MLITTARTANALKEIKLAGLTERDRLLLDDLFSAIKDHSVVWINGNAHMITAPLNEISAQEAEELKVKA